MSSRLSRIIEEAVDRALFKHKNSGAGLGDPSFLGTLLVLGLLLIYFAAIISCL